MALKTSVGCAFRVMRQIYSYLGICQDAKGLNEWPKNYSESGRLLLNLSSSDIPLQTVTYVVESESELAKLFKLLSEVENIPRWDPAFADKIERIGDSRCCVVKNSETFELEVWSNLATFHKRSFFDAGRPAVVPSF